MFRSERPRKMSLPVWPRSPSRLMLRCSALSSLPWFSARQTSPRFTSPLSMLPPMHLPRCPFSPATHSAASWTAVPQRCSSMRAPTGCTTSAASGTLAWPSRRGSGLLRARKDPPAARSPAATSWSTATRPRERFVKWQRRLKRLRELKEGGGKLAWKILLYFFT